MYIEFNSSWSVNVVNEITAERYKESKNIYVQELIDTKVIAKTATNKSNVLENLRSEEVGWVQATRFLNLEWF